MGGQAKTKVARHRYTNRSSGGSSSSSGKASSSAPHSVKSTHSISRLDGPNSPPSAEPKSPKDEKSPQRKSPKSPEDEKIPSSSAPTRSIPIVPKNFDLGASQWALIYGRDVPNSLPTRPKTTSKLGSEAKVHLNTFNVTSYPTKDIYQLQVQIGTGVEKRGVIDKVWESKALKDALGEGVIFDGDRLAWSLREVPREIRTQVDLDREHGRAARPGKNNVFRVVIRQTNKIRFDVLQNFLAGRISFDKHCLEAINCLDHVLREHPRARLLAVKRAFFPRAGQGFDLGGGLHALKGAYQSLRPVLGVKGPTLSINVDVANGTFFTAMPLLSLIMQMTGCRDVNDLERQCKQSGSHGRVAKDMKRLQKRRVLANHRQGHEDEYVIHSFDWRGAKQVKFDQRDPKTGAEKSVTVAEYFRKEYGKTLLHPDLPLVKTPKGAYVPIECLKLKPNQVCKYKLDERQTAQMIKFAVTPPAERWGAVEAGLKTLSWQADPVMRSFGLQVSAERTTVPARILPAPKVVFAAGGTANPGTSGRWDLKGKKFLSGNTSPLKAWGIMVISGTRGGKPDKSTIENFVKAFVNTYISHGGKVETKQPPMILSAGNDVAAWVTTAWNTIGKQFNVRPQMIIFILPDKSSEVYNRIKRSMDCRFGAVSQCVQYSHAQKAAPQYLSNVCMKFNAKLGGVTCRAVGAKSGGNTGLFTVPTIVIGADVSHAAPGSQAASTAAITVSTDQLGVQYAAAVESNGYRVEMITESTIKKHVTPMLQHWCSTVNNGKLPARVIYIRDGVSEGQFQQVLEQEVVHLKAIFSAASASANVDFVVIIAQKRHQIRFFPERGDRNGNALPGTLVEMGVTHPFENDFFLCAHAAIKGTARPVHYQVIMNEKMSNDEIHMLLYEHSYQYLRATTPVSIHPAVYYAHIASNRAVCHDPKWGSNPDESSSDPHSSQNPSLSAISEPLLPMPNEGGIRMLPWYI